MILHNESIYINISIEILHKVHLKSSLKYASHIPKYREREREKEREREREREITNLSEGLLLNYALNV